VFLAWVAFQYAYVSLATIYSGRDGRSLPVSTTRELPAQRRGTQKELVSLQ
jgi:hypothetical protein